jgi:hypothetical protein
MRGIGVVIVLCAVLFGMAIGIGMQDCFDSQPAVASESATIGAPEVAAKAAQYLEVSESPNFKGVFLKRPGDFEHTSMYIDHRGIPVIAAWGNSPSHRKATTACMVGGKEGYLQLVTEDGEAVMLGAADVKRLLTMLPSKELPASEVSRE